MEQAEIPVFRPHLGPDTLQAVAEAFEVGWIGMGATTKAFEDALQAHFQTDRHVVATMTGTAALHLALRLAGVGPGDEVIVASFNYIADVQAIVMCGGIPVFCDIEESSFGLDPSRVNELVSDRTKAILPLHFAGFVGDIEAIHEIADARGLRVIEDATHALGSSHRGRRVGSFGDIACFSFDPVKIITSLDGGAVACRRDEDISILHRLRLLGVDKDTAERYRNRRAWDYDVTGPGFRAHMTNINAAIGLSQLRRLDEFAANRRRDCQAYNDALAPLDWLITPQPPSGDWNDVAPFIYAVRVADGPSAREAFMQHLRRRGVACGIHFLPLHQMTFCKTFPRGSMDVTERIAGQIVTLPLWSLMPAETRECVIEAVTSFSPAVAVEAA